MSHVRWSEVTAVFGGTFDPPHLGHFDALKGLFHVPGIRRARVIPAGAPPLKTAQTASSHRLAMSRLMVEELNRAGFTDVLLDSREVGAPGPSYSFDTLVALGREEKELAFVLGTDQLAALPRWNRFPELLRLSHWIVLQRKPADETQMNDAMSALIRSNLIVPTADPACFRITGATETRLLQIVPTEARALSSTEIRRQFALQGHVESGLLLPSVEQYLKENGLYGTHCADPGK